MTTMTKQEMIDQLVKDTGLRRPVVRLLVESFFIRTLIELSNGKRLEFRDFGVFEPRTRKARSARNPKTGKVAQVPERRSVRFRPGRKMREGLANPEAVVPRRSKRSAAVGAQLPGSDDAVAKSASENGHPGHTTTVVRRREVAGATAGVGGAAGGSRSRR